MLLSLSPPLSCLQAALEEAIEAVREGASERELDEQVRARARGWYGGGGWAVVGIVFQRVRS
jgi:hypothetical protein